MRPVKGRFAPSPTGDLHFGSLVAAVGSYLEAKSAGGQWLVRIEDLDPPREVQGSAGRILKDLERLGMRADGPVLFQSTRQAAYRDAVGQLLQEGRAFPCACSRKDLPATGIYPGTCRNGIKPGRRARSIRFMSPGRAIAFSDRVQGDVTGYADDFIIRRADGYFAYQLAVVVDDHFQGISQVVRGADLLDSTARQMALQTALGFETPHYMHLPVAQDDEGKKLSKRDRADPVMDQDPAFIVTRALEFLGQQPPPGMGLGDSWAWALDNWSTDLIPRTAGFAGGRLSSDKLTGG
jgi:glutamyl-Q tRNA(Asp) synthetase